MRYICFIFMYSFDRWRCNIYVQQTRRQKSLEYCKYIINNHRYFIHKWIWDDTVELHVFNGFVCTFGAKCYAPIGSPCALRRRNVVCLHVNPGQTELSNYYISHSRFILHGSRVCKCARPDLFTIYRFESCRWFIAVGNCEIFCFIVYIEINSTWDEIFILYYRIQMGKTIEVHYVCNNLFYLNVLLSYRLIIAFALLLQSCI